MMDPNTHISLVFVLLSCYANILKLISEINPSEEGDSEYLPSYEDVSNDAEVAIRMVGNEILRW